MPSSLRPRTRSSAAGGGRYPTDVNGFYRGSGLLKLMAVVGVLWGGVSAAAWAMHRAGGDWAFIPLIVIGAGVLIAVLLFKLIGPLS